MGILCLLNGVALLLFGQSGTGKVAILLQRLCAKFNPVHQENHLVRVPRCSNQLSGLERSHRFSGASGVPDVATQLLTRFPAGAAYLVGNCVGSVVLIAAHDLQHAVRVIGYCIEANQLMCHRDRQQCGGDPFPVVDRLVIEISPMEVIIRIELAVRTWIGKIQCFIRIHGDKNLNQRKQAGKDALP